MPTISDEFKIGRVVTFKVNEYSIVHASQLGPDKEQPVFWEGFINGKPVFGDDGNVLYVPLHCKRVGKDATTVYVSIHNIIRSSERSVNDSEPAFLDEGEGAW